MDELKICSKCRTLYSKSNFYKDRTRRDDYRSECRFCVIEYNKNYYNKNRDLELERCKKYKNNKYKTDINFRLIKRTRNRLYQALNGKTKPSSTKDILGIDIDLYRKWLEFQFTPEMNWLNIEIDHVKPICMFDVTKDYELREAFNWENTQPLLKEVHSQKGIKFNLLDYRFQFIKAYQFIKLNEERFSEDIR